MLRYENNGALIGTPRFMKCDLLGSGIFGTRLTMKAILKDVYLAFENNITCILKHITYGIKNCT